MSDISQKYFVIDKNQFKLVFITILNFSNIRQGSLLTFAWLVTYCPPRKRYTYRNLTTYGRNWTIQWIKAVFDKFYCRVRIYKNLNM